jgi:hypothetical protein
MIYEIVETLLGGKILKRTNVDETETWIPMTDDNSDYQTYLLSLEAKPKK